MNCKNFCNQVSAYIDGLLTPAEKELFEKHCASCAGCAKETAELKNLRLSLLSLKKMPARAGFETSVMAKIESGAGLASFFETFFRAAKAAVLVSLVVFGIIIAFDYFTPAVAQPTASGGSIAALNRYVLQSAAVNMSNEKLVTGR
ncbi:MAG: zf-HC2 domain-containing protein [Endomicrobia bacterium]|nr:zf-HC2 domain-containing protein [Endomicrobiia bacterium]